MNNIINSRNRITNFVVKITPLPVWPSQIKSRKMDLLSTSIHPAAPQASSLAPDSFLVLEIDSHIKHYTPWANRPLKRHVNQFAYALAHEVRNPLATINLSVKMLESSIKDDSLKIYLDIIMRSSMRINNLIKELLTYQQGDEVLTEKHAIQQLLDEVIEMAEDRITLKHVSVKKNYTTPDCQVILDRPKIKIALTNIIINAIDAMGQEKGELMLTTKLIDGKYIVEIEDNGCGISKENVKNIFKPYFTSKPGGLGLGLVTTYDILESNHVDINVESKEGEGTCFILLFNNNNQFIPFK